MSEVIAANTGSAPVNTVLETANTAVNPAAPATAIEPQANTAIPGPEPVLGDKGVEELKTQRRKRQQAEQEAAYWRGVAEAGGKKLEPQSPVVSPPKVEDFQTYDDFLVAKAKHEFKLEQAQINETQEAEREQNRVRAAYNERFRKAIEKHPDLPEVVQAIIHNPNIPQNPAMAQAIMESEVGPEITYHLGQNPQEAIRIALMSPYAAAREIGRIEAKVTSTTQPNTITQAPDPAKVLQARGAVTTFDYEKSSMDDFFKKRNTEAPPRRR